MGRVLGVDYGERRVGLALSDPTGMLASALQVVENRGPRVVVREVLRIGAEQGAERIVVGLPLHMDGGESASTQAARAFAEKLRAESALPVELWDERLSTVSAERALIEGGARRAKRRQVIDKVAAQILLQHYLDTHGPDGGAPW